MEKSKFIPYGRQDVTQSDVNAVVQVLQSDFLTQGPIVPMFEQKLCDHTGAKYSVAVNNCTSALHLACLALGLGTGDVLWTSPITFVASANCALYCGANIDFVDIELDTALMSVKKLKEKLERAEKESVLPKIIIPVHFSGQSCDMKEIYSLGQKYGFKIIEDAAHAIGAKYQNDAVGSCRYSDISVFSFHPVKIITTGEGGAAMTNNPLLAEKMRLLRSHGITRDPVKMQNKLAEPWYYEQINLGFNYRMTDIQAALGLSQLNRLSQYVLHRSKIALLYDEKFKRVSIDIKPLIQKSNRVSAFHLYVVRVMGGSKERNEIYNNLYKKGIGVNLHYIPVNRQPFFYKKLNYNLGKNSVKHPLINTDKYYSQALTLPLYPGLMSHNVEFIIQEILKHVKN